MKHTQFLQLVIIILLMLAAASQSAQTPRRAGGFTNAEWDAVRAAYPDYKHIDAWRPITIPHCAVETVPQELGNQVLAPLGYVDVTAAPFNVDNSGSSDCTSDLQEAINFVRDARLAAFLPAGDYLISDTLDVTQLPYIRMQNGKPTIKSGGDHSFNIVVGSMKDPNKRARIILAPESTGFSDPAQPKIVVRYENIIGPRNAKSKPSVGHYTTHYNQVFTGIDIVIGKNNPGAVGLRLRGAEGCLIQDVTIDATHGDTGLWGVPASGGSTHGLTVIGGRIGIETRNFKPGGKGPRSADGAQPSPTFTQLRLVNQRDYAIYSRTRGAVTLVGASIETNRPGPVIGLEYHWKGCPFNGVFGLVDSQILYQTPNSDNIVVEAVGKDGRSFYWNNVYLKNTSKVIQSHGHDIAGNVKGWIRLRELACHLKPERASEEIYIDGKPYGDSLIDVVSGTSPPPGFLDRHSWGKSLPSFESKDIAILTDYRYKVVDGDWQPAFQAAIREHKTVFIPKGDYSVKNTIRLKPHTRLIGVHHYLSHIRGEDTEEARFGNNPQPESTALPVLATARGAQADNYVGNLWISVPNTLTQHGSEALACFPILWQAGPHSVINAVSFQAHSQNNHRPGWVPGRRFKLKNVPSPYLHKASGIQIAATSQRKQIYVEPVNANPRLTAAYRLSGSSVTLTKADNRSFTLNSLKLANATFNDDPQYSVTLTGTKSDGRPVKQSFDFAADGQTNPRTKQHTMTLNWRGLKKVTFIAPWPFALDDIKIGQHVIDFSELTEAKTVKEFAFGREEDFYHYPIYPQRVSPVQVTGGLKWYNLFYHGEYGINHWASKVNIHDNSYPVHIYHAHQQHGRVRFQVQMNRARDVSVYGIKTENIYSFIRATDSDRIRIIGYGGMTHPPRDDAFFLFQNTPNFLVACVGGDTIGGENNKVTRVSNPLRQGGTGTYHCLFDEFEGQLIKTPKEVRPILYRRGQPTRF